MAATAEGGSGGDTPLPVYRKQNLDVQDKHGVWYEARVEEIEKESAYIHYTFWDSHYDEWIPLSSPRLAPFGFQVYVAGQPLRTGQKVDVWDTHPKVLRWLEGRVVDSTDTQVKIHFRGFAESLDEWLDRSATFTPAGADAPLLRFAPFGSHTRHRKPYRPPSYFYWRNTQRRRAVAAASSMFARYTEALRQQGLGLVSVEGDGNCMFRSLAHQVYGDDAHHAIARKAAADYMAAEQVYFQGWIASDFPDYIANLRKNGTWGDDPELQALSEVYDRPVEIWVPDAAAGAKVLKTLHGVRSERTPMRLSYYGGGHYDSIVGPGFKEAHLSSDPGKREGDMVRVATLRRSPAATGAAAAGDAELLAVLTASREAYADLDSNLDAALRASLGTSAEGEASAAVEDGIAAAVAADSEVSATQAAILQHLQEEAARKEEAELAAAIRASEAAATGQAPDQAVDPELAAALAASTGGGGGVDPELAAVLAASTGGGGGVDPELAAVLAASLADASAGVQGGGELDEDMLLRLALEESLQGGGS